MLNLLYKRNNIHYIHYVTNQNSSENNLLGLPAIISLNLAMRVQQIEETSTPVQDEFPNILKGWAPLVRSMRSDSKTG